MDLLQPHLMYHRIHGRRRELVDQDRIVMMDICLQFLIEPVAKKKRFVVEIDLDIHRLTVSLQDTAFWNF
jgi:hypothetical protein